MPRPCEHRHIFSPGTCTRCRLYRDNEEYRRYWDTPVEERVSLPIPQFTTIGVESIVAPSSTKPSKPRVSFSELAAQRRH